MAILHKGQRITSLRIEHHESSDASDATLKLQSKSVTPSTEEQIVTSEEGYDGLSQVIVGAIPDEFIVPSGTKMITTNGIHSVAEYADVNVSVSSGASGGIDDEDLQEQTETIDAILDLLPADVYPAGAFRVVSAFTSGKSYVLGFSYNGTRYHLGDTAFNDYTVQAATLSVQEQDDYVTFSGNPVRFTATASGDGVTLSTTNGSLTGNAASYGTDLKINTETGTVFTIDTSETGGFSSGTYIPKVDSGQVWLRASLNSQNCCLKYESANTSVGIDYTGRDATYSTGFIPFYLYELCEGEELDTGDLSDNTEKLHTILDKVQDLQDDYMPVEMGTPVISVSSGGLITASVEQESGLVESGTTSATHQLTVQAGTTIVPTKSTQTAVESERYTTGRVSVGAIPAEYIVPSGTRNITTNGTYDATQYSQVNVNVAGSAMTVGSVTIEANSNARLSFGGISAIPTWFSLMLADGYDVDQLLSYEYCCAALTYCDGHLFAIELYNNEIEGYEADDFFDISFQNGTLTISTDESYFLQSCTYTLFYGV